MKRRRLVLFVIDGERRLYSTRARNRPRGGGETRHDSVARVFDLVSAVRREPLTDDAIVCAYHILGTDVAAALREGGRSFDVGKKHGDGRLRRHRDPVALERYTEEVADRRE